MKLITKSIREKLEANYKHVQAKYEAGDGDINETVVCKFFNPMGAGTWLITQIEPDGDTLWGLADIGFGCVEYGTISLSELKSIRVMGLGIERDLHFDPKGRRMADFLDMETLSGIS